MKIVNSEIPEVLIINSKQYKDNRGWFMESFRLDLLESHVGHALHFCQENLSKSHKGVIRGLHFQLEPYAQSKLVGVLLGRVLDVIVDIRKGSTTFGKHIAVELSAENQLQIFIPRGFAHGYICLSEFSIFSYKADNYYNKESEGSIAYNDPKLGIDWILDPSTFLISEKDKLHPNLDQAQCFNFKKPLYD